MDSETSHEDAQEGGQEPLPVIGPRIYSLLGRIHFISAFFAEVRALAYFCSTFTAIHNLEFKVTDTTKIIPFSKNGVALKALMVNYMTKLRSSKNTTAKVVNCCLVGV